MSSTQTRRRGWQIAAGIAIGGLVIVGLFRLNPYRPVPPANQAGEIDMPAPIGNGGPERFSAGQDIRVEMIDESDGALRAVLTASRLDPLGDHRYTIADPRVTYFHRDGQTIYMRADRGEVYIPSGQEHPEHGSLSGNVEIRLFDPVGAGSAVDVEGDRPVMIGYFESVRFDTTLGQLSTERPIRIVGDEFVVRGVGLDALANLSDASLNSLRITRGRFARYVPSVAIGASRPREKTESRSRPAPRTPPRTSDPPAETASGPQATNRLYRIDFADDVALTRGGRRIESDQLSLWVRMRDNRLPEGAIPQLKGVSKRSSAPGVPFGPALAHAIARFIPAAQPEGEPNEPNDDRLPIELRWSGPMIVTPLDETPSELAGGNHVFMRFSSSPAGQVRISDTETGSTATCAWMEYAATTQIARMGGEGEAGVRLLAPNENLGTVEVRLAMIEVDLGRRTFDIPGPGFADNAETGQRIQWATHASGDLAFDREHVIGVERALFEGAATVISPDGRASGDSLTTTFEPTGGSMRLRRAVFDGHARARGPRQESLDGDRIEVYFEPGQPDAGGSTRPVPTLLIATGQVVARQPGSVARCEVLTAELGSIDGTVRTDRVELEGAVSFVRDDGRSPRSTATADRIIAHPQQKSAELFGRPDQPAEVTHGGTTLTGPQISLDEIARRVRVFGRGKLVHIEDDQVDRGAPALTLTWMTDMLFDDGEGLIEGYGSVHADLVPDPLGIDTIDAHRVRLIMEPASDMDAPIVATDGAPAWTGLDRRIRTMEIFGSVLYETGGTDAIVRSRRFAEASEGDAPRTLVRAMNLSGARIIADNTSGVLTVPGRGRLLLVDHTPADSARSGDETDLMDPRGMRGAALFDWDNSMQLDRTTGRFAMDRNVHVSHKRAADGGVLYLVCDSLTGTARVADGQTDPGINTIGDLEFVDAVGAVYARWDGRELLCDRIHYDALAGTVRAESNQSSRITLVDPIRAAVIHAQAATWNLDTGEAQLEGTQPVVVPVGPLPGNDGR